MSLKWLVPVLSVVSDWEFLVWFVSELLLMELLSENVAVISENVGWLVSELLLMELLSENVAAFSENVAEGGSGVNMEDLPGWS